MSATRTQIYLTEKQRPRIDEIAQSDGVTMDRSVAERASRIKRETPIPIPDALVAATALQHHLGVATRNLRHFQSVRGLRLRALR
jgi:predicted nucleic acid-binding protein